MVKAFVTAIAIALGLIVLPSVPQASAIVEAHDEWEWELYRADAFDEYADEFTALFNSYETKWSKNGRLMMRRSGDKSFKFTKRAA